MAEGQVFKGLELLLESLELRLTGDPGEQLLANGSDHGDAHVVDQPVELVDESTLLLHRRTRSSQGRRPDGGIDKDSQRRALSVLWSHSGSHSTYPKRERIRTCFLLWMRSLSASVTAAFLAPPPMA